MNNSSKKIVFIGYMGCGKSTIGKLFAQKMNSLFVDLDDYIVEKENISISKLFRLKGENYFRNIEFESLKQLLKNKDIGVIALGGGTPTNLGVMEMINENNISIYLKASASSLTKRLYPNKNNRPILQSIDVEMLSEYIESHLLSREKFYNKAKITIETDNKSELEILEKLNTKIAKYHLF